MLVDKEGREGAGKKKSWDGEMSEDDGIFRLCVQTARKESDQVRAIRTREIVGMILLKADLCVC